MSGSSEARKLVKDLVRCDDCRAGGVSVLMVDPVNCQSGKTGTSCPHLSAGAKTYVGKPTMPDPLIAAIFNVAMSSEHTRGESSTLIASSPFRNVQTGSTFEGVKYSIC